MFSCSARADFLLWRSPFRSVQPKRTYKPPSIRQNLLGIFGSSSNCVSSASAYKRIALQPSSIKVELQVAPKACKEVLRELLSKVIQNLNLG